MLTESRLELGKHGVAYLGGEWLCAPTGGQGGSKMPLMQPHMPHHRDRSLCLLHSCVSRGWEASKRKHDVKTPHNPP